MLFIQAKPKKLDFCVMDTDVHAESISVEGEESISVEGGRIRFDTHHLNTSAFLNDMRLIEVPDLSDFWQLRCLHLENNFITNTRGLGVFNSLQVLAMRVCTSRTQSPIAYLVESSRLSSTHRCMCSSPSTGFV
jgi:hypothetical protein